MLEVQRRISTGRYNSIKKNLRHSIMKCDNRKLHRGRARNIRLALLLNRAPVSVYLRVLGAVRSGNSRGLLQLIIHFGRLSKVKAILQYAKQKLPWKKRQRGGYIIWNMLWRISTGMSNIVKKNLRLVALRCDTAELSYISMAHHCSRWLFPING